MGKPQGRRMWQHLADKAGSALTGCESSSAHLDVLWLVAAVENNRNAEGKAGAFETPDSALRGVVQWLAAHCAG